MSLDASGWATAADFHRDVAEALEFPEYYGRNLAAFNDCLKDVVAYSYGSRRYVGGTALVLLRFDAFTDRQPDTAQAVLDIFAGQARTAALAGHRMLCLVQSDDPNLEFSPVGATAVLWNPQEWLNVNRRG